MSILNSLLVMMSTQAQSLSFFFVGNPLQD
jgi:hypothetical protein